MSASAPPKDPLMTVVNGVLEDVDGLKQQARDLMRISQQWKDRYNILVVVILTLLVTSFAGASVLSQTTRDISWLAALMLCPACLMTFMRARGHEFTAYRAMDTAKAMLASFKETKNE